MIELGLLVIVVVVVVVMDTIVVTEMWAVGRVDIDAIVEFIAQVNIIVIVVIVVGSRIRTDNHCPLKEILRFLFEFYFISARRTNIWVMSGTVCGMGANWHNKTA
ncbi:hypothetical protein KDW_27410 [Dictyobacter vulcani]|uniref:Uncharacterized protein n=1 Tax=Dictyobacter vulcani TaxID=2607529 RepID=A0A5J4KR21_9CHLR|nr:hypothetical protein KDW_27410 [Dictyobacter vulcani]